MLLRKGHQSTHDEQTVAEMRTIDLNRIRLFARVVQAGSFTAAAHAAGLPKSSVKLADSRLVARPLGWARAGV